MRATMTLEAWLHQATRGLSAASAAEVRREIQEHYGFARDEALQAGASPDDADRRALASLGNPTTANHGYRSVLLTASEARLLREMSWEARAVCSHLSWIWVLPAATLGAAIWFLSSGRTHVGVMLLLATPGVGLLVACPFLPIYTPSRARLFRALRWSWLAAFLLLAFWPDILKQFWLVASCAWPIVWVEWKRSSLRRKIPRNNWPKMLYL